MKKFLSVLLGLMLVLTCVSAFAEPVKIVEFTNDFDVTVTPPEGYTAEQNQIGDLSMVVISAPGEDTADYVLVINASEEYEDISTLSKEELDILHELYQGEMKSDSYEMKTLENGLTVMCIDIEDEEYDSYIVFTIYKGFFIECSAFMPDFGPMGADKHQITETIMGSLSLTEAAAQ